MEEKKRSYNHTGSVGVVDQAAPGALATHPNDGIDLSEYDYKNMVGKPYERYRDMVEGPVLNENDPNQRRGGGLNVQKKYLFDVYKVVPVYQRLFPLSKIDTTQILSGFKLVSDTPMKSTTTFLRMALQFNEQLDSHQTSGPGGATVTYTYYLLQQPKN